MRSPPWVKLLALLLPSARCAACQTTPYNPFDNAGDETPGAPTAAQVDGRHLLSLGSSRTLYVPCGQERYVGFHDTTSAFRALRVTARAEWAAATLGVQIAGPDGAVNAERTVAVGPAREGEVTTVPVARREDMFGAMWIIRLRAEGRCEGIRMIVSVTQAPMPGP